ncbi:MAG: hypothetical protein MJK18_06475, partial [Bdellovibrionales bacterium]|nr:hypothetical protein [Bdellovibrionales bacterium]
MRTKFSLLSVIVLCLVFAGCSDDSSGGGGSSLNEVATSVNGAKTNLAKVSVFSSSQSASRSVVPSVAADWTASVLTDLGGENCSNTDTPQGLMSEMTNGNCTVSPVFDLNNLFDLMCAVTNELTLTDGLPDAGSQSITISSSTASSCNVADASGFSIDVTVEATTDQSVYQRILVFSIDGDERELMLGSSGTATNAAFTYTEGTTSAYRGYYTTDTATSITRFELQSLSTQGTNNVTLFRFFIDESQTPGEVFGVGTRNDQGNAGLFSRWTFHAPDDGSDQMAVAMAFGGHGGGGTSPHETCV